MSRREHSCSPFDCQAVCRSNSTTRCASSSGRPSTTTVTTQDCTECCSKKPRGHRLSCRVYTIWRSRWWTRPSDCWTATRRCVPAVGSVPALSWLPSNRLYIGSSPRQTRSIRRNSRTRSLPCSPDILVGNLFHLGPHNGWSICRPRLALESHASPGGVVVPSPVCTRMRYHLCGRAGVITCGHFRWRRGCCDCSATRAHRVAEHRGASFGVAGLFQPVPLRQPPTHSAIRWDRPWGSRPPHRRTGAPVGTALCPRTPPPPRSVRRRPHHRR
jgi:hypothetical protein